jgi:CRISPR/Cas system-associated protein Cas5 (RAMP superfamily)
MARAIANCTCKECGKEFEKIKRDCRNRSDANSWEGWAESYYTLCDECSRKEYRKVQEEKAKNNGLKAIRVKYSEYKSKWAWSCRLSRL